MRAQNKQCLSGYLFPVLFFGFIDEFLIRIPLTFMHVLRYTGLPKANLKYPRI